MFGEWNFKCFPVYTLLLLLLSSISTMIQSELDILVQHCAESDFD